MLNGLVQKNECSNLQNVFHEENNKNIQRFPTCFHHLYDDGVVMAYGLYTVCVRKPATVCQADAAG